MPGVHTFYDGSKVLEPVAARIGVEVDMLNLVLCQFLSVPFAILYRTWLTPNKANRNARLAVPLIIGLSLCYFCYGRAMKHPIGMIAVCYSIMRFSPTKYVHKLVFLFSMGYLIFIHWFRWYILTSYSIDITGPMMVLTQKVTTMAFSLHDGRVKKVDELTDIQKREALTEIPSVLEYLSYLLHFQTVLTGPLCFYADYISFVDGSNMTEKERQVLNVWEAVVPKMMFAVCCMVVIAIFQADYYPEIAAEPEYINLPFYKWWPLLFWVIIVKRFQYYYAWIWADCVANLSGFGFNGYDKNNRPKWDLISNVNAWKVEMAFSFKDSLDNWNCTTMYWLRRVAYERVPKRYGIVATYMLSAIWHGFFVGYYLTFLTGALVTVGSRTTRRCLRPYFQQTKSLRIFYDIVTFIATKLCLAYITFPFVTLHLNPGMLVYKKLYFCWHITALFGIFVLPVIFRPPRTRIEKEE